MPPLLATLSPDASRIATLVPTPGMSIRVQILQVPSATLQSTLLHRRKEASEELPRKLLFLSDSLVAAFSTDLIVVWDLNRGVVATVVTPKNKEQTFRDIVSNAGKMYVLVWSHDSQKGQIHCFKPETGKIERKIKAGKGSVTALAVSGSTAVVRQEKVIRTLDIVTGQKQGKYSLTKSFTDVLISCQGLVVTIDGGEVVLLHLNTGDRLGSLPLDHAEDEIDLWATPKEEDGVYARVGSKIYAVSEDGKEATLKCQIASAPTVDTRIIMGDSNTVHALLQKGNHFQTCRETLEKESLQLDWLDPETKEKTSSKRKDSQAVLGPAQKTSGSSGISDGPAAKRLRVEEKAEVDMEVDEEELDEPDESEQGPSIAERLRKLHEAFDAEDDDDDDDADGNADGDKGKTSSDFQVKKATTESLTQLLEQALQSSDDGMLETALRVRDGKVLTESCNSLADDQLLALLTALTSRLASRPTRANELHPWISAILLTGRARSIQHLQPLRNILEERVAVFPALLKLEGRLAMMTNH